MSSFIGGSAYSMANQISEGFILVSTATFKKYQKHEMKTLEAELDKLAREIRGETPPIDDLPAIQRKNRRLGRIAQAQLVMRNFTEQRH